MKIFFTSLLFFFAYIAFAQADQLPAHEEFSWKYAEFVHVFRGKNWDAVCGFVTSTTKAGFGPNEEGCDGVRVVYGMEGQCWDEMMFALHQGCKIKSSGNSINCAAPPQWSDEDIVYLGARASFTYSPETGEFTATHLICGGD